MKERITGKKVVILGAGHAGLAAAYRAARRGADVTVLEGKETVGGLASSFEINGIRVDFGSHRMNYSLDPELQADLEQLLGDDLLTRPRNTRIRLRDRWVRVPLRLSDAFRLPMGFVGGCSFDMIAGATRRFLGRQRNGTHDFRTVMLNDVGPTLCRDYYFPYHSKVWGLPPEELSLPRVVDHKKENGSLIAKVATTAAISKRSGGDRSYYYPKQGYGQISDSLCKAAQSAGAKFKLGARVTVIDRDDFQTTGVRYEQEGREHFIQSDCIWSTMPITLLARCLQPSAPEEVLGASANLTFRGVLLVYLELAQGRFSDYDTHVVPNPRVSITRISEPKIQRDSIEPQGRTVICLEIPLDPNASEWDLKDEELGRLSQEWLGAIGLPIEVPILSVVTRRLRRVYPVYKIGTAESLAIVHRWIENFEGLLTFGLQGLFAPEDSHHILSMAYSAVECLDDQGEFDWERWRDYRKLFERRVAKYLRIR